MPASSPVSPGTYGFLATVLCSIGLMLMGLFFVYPFQNEPTRGALCFAMLPRACRLLDSTPCPATSCPRSSAAALCWSSPLHQRPPCCLALAPSSSHFGQASISERRCGICSPIALVEMQGVAMSSAVHVARALLRGYSGEWSCFAVCCTFMRILQARAGRHGHTMHAAGYSDRHSASTSSSDSDSACSLCTCRVPRL